MATFFTADTHFGHTNIIKFCERPFADADEMDAAITARWNAVVGDNDDVWHLGDFAFRDKRVQVERLFAGLRGRKHLIIGNHDGSAVLNLPWTTKPVDYRGLAVRDGDFVENLILFHYGIRSWDNMFHGSLHLYGHSHGRLPGSSKSLDVGVDCWDFTPVTLATIKARMATLPHPNPETERNLV